jgi:hypothetical protein
LLRGQPCAPQRSLNAFNPHIRNVREIRHADYDTPCTACQPATAWEPMNCSLNRNRDLLISAILLTRVNWELRPHLKLG